MALDWSQCPAVERVAGKVSGAIMGWFQGLDREQIKAVIEFAARSLDETPFSAVCR